MVPEPTELSITSPPVGVERLPAAPAVTFSPVPDCVTEPGGRDVETDDATIDAIEVIGTAGLRAVEHAQKD